MEVELVLEKRGMHILIGKAHNGRNYMCSASGGCKCELGQ